MTIREPRADDGERLRAFFARVPDEDRGFIDDLDEPAVERRWIGDGRGVRLAAVADDGSFATLAAIRRASCLPSSLAADLRPGSSSK